MDLQFLNDALSAFTQAFDAAANTLIGVGLAGLAVLALIAWYTTYRYTVFSSGAGLSEAMAGAILSMITFGVTMWIITNLPAMTDALYRAFATWGSGGALSPDDLLNPAAIVDQGFQQARPIRDFTDRLVSWLKVWDWDTLLTYSLSYYAIVLGFFFIGVTMMITIIELKLAVMLGAILIPTAVWQTSAFLAEAAIGWIVGGAVRVFILAALLGISQPLLANITPAMGAGDPDFKSAILCGIVSLLFAVLAWVVPRRAAALVGQGLALTGAEVVGGAMSGVRAGQIVIGGVQRVTSTALEAIRAGRGTTP
jgi:type IV secretion system protein TrbL